MTAEEFLLSKYTLVSKEWFNDDELTQEMITMMEAFAKINLREELIKYDLWLGNWQCENNVDSYLNQKEK